MASIGNYREWYLYTVSTTIETATNTVPSGFVWISEQMGKDVIARSALKFRSVPLAIVHVSI
jgi:hypothetical protein